MAPNRGAVTSRTGIALALAAVSLVLAVTLAPGGLSGCDEQAGADTQIVRIAGRAFHLELAADDATRIRGLSERTFIEPDGGMLFVFPQPARLGFVMRDCPIPIDIIFLDGSGRVVATHAMQPEPPRAENEGKPGEINPAYESRLKTYSSRYNAQFAIELAGGTLPSLGLKEGDRVDLPVQALKRRAR